MPKSGSTFLYQLVHNLTLKEGGWSTEDIQSDEVLSHLLSGAHNYVKANNAKTLLKLVLKAGKRGLVVKTHSPCSKALKRLTRWGLIKVIYLYRDPRDVIASTLDYARFLKETDQNDSFRNIDSFKKALKEAEQWCEIAESYLDIPAALKVKYEELVADNLFIYKKVTEFLNIRKQDSELKDILSRFQPGNIAFKSNIKFNKGKVGRYREYFSEEEQEEMNQTLKAFLNKWGYKS